MLSLQKKDSQNPELSLSTGMKTSYAICMPLVNMAQRVTHKMQNLFKLFGQVIIVFQVILIIFSQTPLTAATTYAKDSVKHQKRPSFVCL